MNNDLLSFERLEKELSSYKKVLQEASDTIVDENVSEYPIFIVHKQRMDMGLNLVEKTNDLNRQWNVEASTLEEFISRQIIEENKLDSFKTVYKNRKTHLCLFVISELGANFIFLPRQDVNQ